MRRVFIVIAAVMILSSFTVNVQIHISGALSGTFEDTTYIVDGNIRVNSGDSLIIEPGAEFLFNQGIEFDINGYLYAVGTETDSIKFVPNIPDTTWGGIDFNSSSHDSCKLAYSLITGSISSGISCQASSPSIIFCAISDNSNLEGHGGGIRCVESSNPIIRNCVISGDSVPQYYSGGGIYCNNSNPIISDCEIFDNTSLMFGGGIYCSTNSNCEIISCEIYGNYTGGGGGIACYYSNPLIYGCIIREHDVADGGGILCWYSNPTIDNCVITGNSACWLGGGGIQCYDSSNPVITNCIISENTGWCGGGIYCIYNSNPIVSDCNINMNVAQNNGGGIYYSDSSPTIVNSLICSNVSPARGGGFYFNSANPTLINCTISGNITLEGGGIYSFGSDPNIQNTIVEGNTGNYGVYFYNSPDASLTYNDFYNNENGNLGGAVPPLVGTILFVNANGDSCDTFYNIFEDPLFYSTTGDSAFYLTANSPCIDAGDPISPLDPDSTIADIGAFYFDQSQFPLITVTLSPYNPPIQIPANGGTFGFNIAISNNDSLPVNFEVWTIATLPNGNEYGPIIGPLNLTFAPGFSANRDRTQSVPAGAPAGAYTYDAYVGIYPITVWSEDHFDFEKLVDSDGGLFISDWVEWGEPFTNEASASIHPSSLILHPSYPNPFNAKTTISYQLSANSYVKLVVYDIQGREVQSLVNSQRSAGYHQVIFDGSGLSSGIYFAHLQVGGFTQSRKLLLIK